MASDSFPKTNSAEEIVAIFPTLVADANGHKWIEHRDIVSCAICGTCRVFDQAKQKTCKGPVRISLRNVCPKCLKPRENVDTREGTDLCWCPAEG